MVSQGLSLKPCFIKTNTNMNNLTIFGKEHPVDKEIELFDDSEFGMDCVIRYRDDIDRHYTGITETRHNCTEFHHLYNIEDKQFDRLSSAFESDIHGTGGTKDIELIEWIQVTKATKKHETY